LKRRALVAFHTKLTITDEQQKSKLFPLSIFYDVFM